MAATSQLTATLRLGLAQIDSKLGDVAANVDKVCGLINDVRQRVDLLVFPELALTGYAVGSQFGEYQQRNSRQKCPSQHLPRTTERPNRESGNECSEFL